MRHLEEPKSQRGKVEWWVPGTGRVGQGVSVSWGQSFRLRRWKRSGDGTVVTVQQCKCAQCHRTVHLKVVKQ